MMEYVAADLKVMALHWLRGRYPDALLTMELAVGKYGSASLDVAAVTETEIVGVEVKGAGDSHARLERQGHAYGQRARLMWLLCTPALERSCGVRVPPGWGWLTIEEGAVAPSPIWQAASQWNSAGALLDILWKPELCAVARELAVAVRSRGPVQEIVEVLAEAAPLAVLRPAVCRQLRGRQWESRMNGLSKAVWRAGDALPELPVPSLAGAAGGEVAA